MAQFRFLMVGGRATPVFEVAASSLGKLRQALKYERHLEAKTIDEDGDGQPVGVLITTGRIEMIFEVEP